jgi:hypothetical protein
MCISFPASLFCFIQEKTEIFLCLDERSEGKDNIFIWGVLNPNFSPGF